MQGVVTNKQLDAAQQEWQRADEIEFELNYEEPNYCERQRKVLRSESSLQEVFFKLIVNYSDRQELLAQLLSLKHFPTEMRQRFQKRAQQSEQFRSVLRTLGDSIYLVYAAESLAIEFDLLTGKLENRQKLCYAMDIKYSATYNAMLELRAGLTMAALHNKNSGKDIERLTADYDYVLKLLRHRIDELRAFREQLLDAHENVTKVWGKKVESWLTNVRIMHSDVVSAVNLLLTTDECQETREHLAKIEAGFANLLEVIPEAQAQFAEIDGIKLPAFVLEAVPDMEALLGNKYLYYKTGSYPWEKMPLLPHAERIIDRKRISKAKCAADLDADLSKPAAAPAELVPSGVQPAEPVSKPQRVQLKLFDRARLQSVATSVKDLAQKVASSGRQLIADIGCTSNGEWCAASGESAFMRDLFKGYMTGAGYAGLYDPQSYYATRESLGCASREHAEYGYEYRPSGTAGPQMYELPQGSQTCYGYAHGAAPYAAAGGYFDPAVGVRVSAPAHTEKLEPQVPFFYAQKSYVPSEYAKCERYI